ncbi:hypothetical protein [Maridesulfovibrio frigidus]|uniref:hypothetical protein n=1 Tax=Maridesulfovibrio frigidus TaxID=340956 RepID=UPI0004E1DA63|nr:hypothetical protein [Maridesulfovibrio frigidus]
MNPKFRLIPYLEWDGIRSFPDSYIKDLFERIEVEGHADTVFYEEKIHSADGFVKVLKDAVAWIVVQDEIAVGLVWLDRHEGRFARMHWVVFEACPRRDLIELGRFTYNEILNMKNNAGEYIYDMLLGYTPIRNKSAVKFVMRCGGQLCG